MCVQVENILINILVVILLFLSFLILNYVATKIYARKQSRQIESDFEHFKLVVTKDAFIQNAIECFHLDVTTESIFNKLLHATNISEFDISKKHRIPPVQRLLSEWNNLSIF